MQANYEAARIRALSLNRGMVSDVPFGCGGRGGGGQGNGAAVGFGYGRHRIGSYATLARFELTSAEHCKSSE